MPLQSILFNKTRFTKAQAVAWLKRHHKKTYIRGEKGFYHARQTPPNYERTRNKKLTGKGAGIEFVIGFNGPKKRRGDPPKMNPWTVEKEFYRLLAYRP